MELNKKITEMWIAAASNDDREEFIITQSRAKKCASDERACEYIGEIWDLAHMNVRSIVKSVKLTQESFSLLMGVPKRTVEDWCRGVACPPNYVRLWMQIMLGMIDDPPYSIAWI